MRQSWLYTGMLLCICMNAMPQGTSHKYWVQLRDKEYNEYSLENPGEFLTSRSLERRARQDIPVTLQDLPVSTAYLDSLEEHPLRILYTSKWMNAVVVETQDTGLASTLLRHDFVSDVECLYHPPNAKKSTPAKWDADGPAKTDSDDPQPATPATQQMDLVSDHQIEMLQGHLLHQAGFSGQGMVIAVLDAGFAHADTMVAFDSLFAEGRILGTRNFVEPDSFFFWKVNGPHGTHVLSIMAADMDGQFRGSAPKAGYWLIQTEDVRSEDRIEEANWLAGAELADSAGADVINSSLSYFSGFTDTTQNYRYEDLDGVTALATRAAQIAASRGMLVVASAGNKRNVYNPAGYVAAPADGKDVLAVGAVDAYGTWVDFSARGPSYDGRIKPDVSAQGYLTWLVRYTGKIEQGNGTSYSSPVVGGLAACLLQKHPDTHSGDLMEAIRSSSSLNPYPDNMLGWGLPNFALAGHIITDVHPPREMETQLLIFPNPAREFICLHCIRTGKDRCRYRILDAGGRLRLEGEIIPPGESMIPIRDLPPGSYILVVSGERQESRGLFIKLP